jgi:alpha-beta hydrolase superfamily lysophospholipase
MADMTCEPVKFTSSDGAHTISGYIYTMPGVTLRGVLQLSHGMCEYVERYHGFASFFARRGFAVAGNDHLGHGSSVPAQEYGRFGPKGARWNVLRDLKTMNEKLHERFPGLPVILYGHSMGSFFARWYAEVYPDSIAGLIISGTGGPSAANSVGMVLADVLCFVKGENAVSPLMVRMNFGTYCKRIPDAASPNAWLTRDPEVVKAYDADPKCAFRFSVGAYREMLHTLHHVSSRRWAQSISKTLPVLLVAGGQDPVGNYGEGVRRVYAMLGDAGVQDLTCHIDPDGRHELHNEINKEETGEFVMQWLNGRWPATGKEKA